MTERAKTGATIRAMPVRGPTELQQLQKRTSHQKLLDATYSAFSELSYPATTIDDIVGRAQVNRSTFYRHFDSKFAVAKALYGQFWPKLFAEYDRLTMSDPDEADLDAWIDGLIEFYRANKPLMVTLGQIPALEREGARWEEDKRREIIARLGTRIAAFRKSSAPAEATPDSRVAARMAMMVFETGIYHLSFMDDSPERDAIRRYTISEFLRFIREGAD
ncbi:MAG TPA: TetR/AcrR family transcriptional regulator [Alphaproteobacteria bacterium]|nr:TetR/AcrR family transcriptional regulator [Alphaproteobacteria bacterium]